MPTISPTQVLSVLTFLAEFPHMVRPQGPAWDAVVEASWERAGEEAGLAGRPRNERNSLVQHSRLLQATTLTGETCLGLLFQNEGKLYLGSRDAAGQTAFRLTMPAAFRSYRHCTNPLTPDGLNLLDIHALDGNATNGRRKIKSRTYVRLSDLWKAESMPIDGDKVQALIARPADLAVWGGLTVTRAFDCDLRQASSPWARFILGREGIEEAVAARKLGMEWVPADENAAAPMGTIFTHHPL